MSEKIDACLYCGAQLTLAPSKWGWECRNSNCPLTLASVICYAVPNQPTAIAAHNRLCRLVKLGRVAMELIENPPSAGLLTKDNKKAEAFQQGMDYIITRLEAALEDEDEPED